MTFPALEAFEADQNVGRLTFRTYRHLRTAIGVNFDTPIAAKTSALAHDLRMRPTSLSHALNWLVAHGYLIEHARGARGVRRFTLAYDAPATVSQSVAV